MSGITLSFCTPVMNRLSDLQATLRRNLEDNRAQQDRVEFVVVCFDQSDETDIWVHENFSADLASGYLSFHRSRALESWHFGKAKNAFRGLTRGRIYASLDGDNFTGLSGGQHIIDVFESMSYDCLFHQFQGDWGDGTCGRVSMTMHDYEVIGYDEQFLPRQWDELDAMLSILVRQPTRRYICYQGKSIIRKSQPFARFLRENKIEPVVVELDGTKDPLTQVSRPVAVGQHQTNYVQHDSRLKYFSQYNHLFSYIKNCHCSSLQETYVSEIVATQREMVRHLPAELLCKAFLTCTTSQAVNQSQDDITLIACVSNESSLPQWIEHYRRLGVTRFLLIDDHSIKPVGSTIQEQDVIVWRPIAGRFRFSKAFWIELLARCFCDKSWTVIVDADEYLCLPERCAKNHDAPVLTLLTQYAEAGNIEYFCGFLLDVVPGPEAYAAVNLSGTPLTRSQYKYFQFRPETRAGRAYRTNKGSWWSYGECVDWAHGIDIRFRLNRSFDSLRKFPLIKFNTSMHIHQGFHDLIVNGKSRTWHELQRLDLLPLLHYKFYHLQFGAIGQKRSSFDSYYSVTQENLVRLHDERDFHRRQAIMSPFTYEWFDYSLIPIPMLSSITLRYRDKATFSSFANYIQRRAEVIVVAHHDVKWCPAEGLHAPSIAVAAEWVRTHTPFQHVVRLDDESAELSVGLQ